MKRVLLAVLAATAIASLLPTGADAALNMTYQGFNFSHQGYDYAPSIVRDAAAGQWVMYECGVYTGSDGYSGDGIFRSTSGDGVNWSSPRIALTVGASGAWDDRPAQTICIGVDSEALLKLYSGVFTPNSTL